MEGNVDAEPNESDREWAEREAREHGLHSGICALLLRAIARGRAPCEAHAGPRSYCAVCLAEARAEAIALGVARGREQGARMKHKVPCAGQFPDTFTCELCKLLALPVDEGSHE